MQIHFTVSDNDVSTLLLSLNLLRLEWRAKLSQTATFSQFQVCFNVTQAKQVINLLPLNHFYPVTYRRIRKEEIIVYGH